MSALTVSPIPAELARASTAELRAELARGLALTADTLLRLGMVWAELEHRGEDLSDLRHGLARTLPLIASGRLAAEAVVAFAGRPLVLRQLDGVPLDRQRQLAAGEPVEVIDPGDPSNVVSLPLAVLPAAAVRLLLVDGEVRTPSQQRLAFRTRGKRRDAEGDRRYHPHYDPVAGTIAIGRMKVAIADLLSAIAAVAGPDRPIAADLPAEYVTIRVRLSHDERLRLSAAATKAELPDWELVRKAIRAFGLI